MDVSATPACSIDSSDNEVSARQLDDITMQAGACDSLYRTISNFNCCCFRAMDYILYRETKCSFVYLIYYREQLASVVAGSVEHQVRVSARYRCEVTLGLQAIHIRFLSPTKQCNNLALA